MTKTFTLIILLITFYFEADSQSGDSVVWKNTERSIKEKESLITTRSRMEQIKRDAWATGNYINYARAAWNEMLIRDATSEDTFYFRNSFYLDSILSSPTAPRPLQLLMHVLQAKRLALMPRVSSSRRVLYKVAGSNTSNAAMNAQQADSVIILHFESARAIAKNTNYPFPLQRILWLSSDPGIFLFKPDIADILLGEEIKYEQSNKQSSYFGDVPSNWLTKKPDEFITLIDSVGHSNHRIARLFRLYSEWLQLKNNRSTNSTTDAYYFIEMLAHKSMYALTQSTDARESYFSYLQGLEKSTLPPVRAYALYQLSMLYAERSGGYYSGYNFNIYSFDSSRRDDAGKAVAIYKEHKELFNDYPSLRRMLENKMMELSAKVLRLQIDDNILPGQPLLAQIIFKNINQLHYRIVQISSREKDYSDQSAIRRLCSRNPVRETSIDLQSAGPYNTHSSYLTIDALPAGRYCLLTADHVINEHDTTEVNATLFTVSQIATIAVGDRIYVMDRKSGMPVSNVSLSVSRRGYPSEKPGLPYVNLGSTNKEGYVTASLDNPYYYASAIYGNDTTITWLNIDNPKNNSDDDTYNKEDYDDLIEYYDEHTELQIFTDRAIYRPGQTVYYKVILWTRNPETGARMILNQQNLKNNILKSAYKKWLKESAPWLFINDPFSREMDSIKVVPNEFGSISGSFKIPANAATGEWTIEPDYFDAANENNGDFKVEEYKRPTYELKLENPKKELKPGDSFPVTVKLRSFAGASLNNVRVTYKVFRSNYYHNNNTVYSYATLFDTVGYTNASGELIINVIDKEVAANPPSNEMHGNLVYSIEVTSIDETGENYNQKTRVIVALRPINIRIPLSGTYERNKLPSVIIKTTDENAGEVFRKVKVRLYKIINQDPLRSERNYFTTDYWIVPATTLSAIFPYESFDEKREATRELIYETIINTGAHERLELPQDKIVAGSYELEARCEENEHIYGINTTTFTIYDFAKNQLPEPSMNFHKLLSDGRLERGDTVKILTGNSEMDIQAVYYIQYFSKKGNKTELQKIILSATHKKGLDNWQYIIPADVIDQLQITEWHILENKLYQYQETIRLIQKKIDQPTIIIEKYRQKMQPGAEGNFTLSVVTNNEKVAAELMTVIYDASLDKLERHVWALPRGDRSPYLPRNNMPAIVGPIQVTNYNNQWQFAPDTIRLTTPNWWLNEVQQETKRYFNVEQVLTNRVSGLTVYSEPTSLSEVVVTGYGSKRIVSGENPRIVLRGLRSISGDNTALIVVDGVPMPANTLNYLNPDDLLDIVTMEGGQSATLFGSDGVNGAIIITTKKGGGTKLPAPPEPVVKIRKNFNETAFFAPSIHADKDGRFSFSFTMPESVTEWNWKLLAHTTDARFVLEERKLQTQLPLMVQPNMPRLLYQGDQLILKSRITNLDTLATKGTLTCKIEDAVTGEDLTAKLLASSSVNFTAAGKGNTAGNFSINVPGNQTNPLKIVIKAATSEFADAEEHIIPVLSGNIFARKQVAVRLSNMDTTIALPSLPIGSTVFGLGLSISPQPQAALLESLPYLAHYSYDCAEQTFGKMLAYITAMQIMRKDTAASLLARQLNTTVGNDSLPDQLAEQTMPWLTLSHTRGKQQRELRELLDTMRSKEQVEEKLNKIIDLQNSDGGISWFKGGRSNAYISAYLLAGLGKEKDFIGSLKSYRLDKFMPAIERLIPYIDAQLVQSKDIFYCHARYQWNKTYPVTGYLKDSILAAIRQEGIDINRQSLRKQALFVITCFEWTTVGSDLYNKAVTLLDNIRQLAIADDGFGIRWKELSDDDDLYSTTEETVSMLAEAFGHVPGGDEMQQGIIKWLLNAKTDHHWSNTKATEAVIDLLLKTKQPVLNAEHSLNTSVAGKSISVSNSLLAGQPFSFIKTTSLPATLPLKKTGTGITTGYLITSFFAPANKLESLNDEIMLSKHICRYNEASASWDTLSSDGATIKTGERLKIVLTITTKKMLRYVYIDDKRSGALEPMDNSSGYQYDSGMYYYKSVRDAGCQFFADEVPAGKTVISYEVKVSQQGEFTNGPAMLQCMYKPEMTAYSNSSKIVTQ